MTGQSFAYSVGDESIPLIKFIAQLFIYFIWRRREKLEPNQFSLNYTTLAPEQENRNTNKILILLTIMNRLLNIYIT